MVTVKQLKKKISMIKKQSHRIAIKRVKDTTTREKRIYPGLARKRIKLEDQLYYLRKRKKR